MQTINHINAGILHTHGRMAGLDLDGALKLARRERLSSDLDHTPHRATVLRLLRQMWLRADREAAERQAADERAAAFDAQVAARFPEAWAHMEAKVGAKRREARRLLRKRFVEQTA